MRVLLICVLLSDKYLKWEASKPKVSLDQTTGATPLLYLCVPSAHNALLTTSRFLIPQFPMSKASFYHHATGYAGVFFSGKFQHRNPQKRTPGAERESLPPDSLSKHPNADGKQTKALRRAHRRGLQLTDKRTPAPRRQRCCEAAVSQPCRVYGATRCTTGPRTSKDQLSHPPRERSPGNTRARLK